MYPILFSWGGFELHTYAVTLAVGFMAAIQFANYLVEKRGIDLQKVLNLEVVLILSSLVGARALFVIVEWDWYRQHPWDIPLFWKGGLVFYGGLLGAVAACIWYARRVGLPWLACADISAPSIAIGQFFGRIGCLMGGCCYGRPTDLPWGMAFPVTTGDTLLRHPSQIYEMAAVAAIFAILYLYYRREDRPDGTVLVMYGYLYGTARFLLEFLRGDDRGDFYFQTLSVSQTVSLGVVVLALTAHMLLTLRHRSARR